MNFEECVRSPQMRHAYQVGYSVQLLGEICANYRHAQDGLDTVYSASMLDAFYVHIRLLAEFLVKEPKTKDFGVSEFADDWSPPPTRESERLRQYWETASKYVVHFGHARVPENLDDLSEFDVSEGALKAMATDAFAIMEHFVSLVESQCVPADRLDIPQLRAQFLRRTLNEATLKLEGQA